MGEKNGAAPAGAGGKAGATAHAGVAALERGLSLLGVLTQDGLSLSEAARRAGLNKTTAFRLMKTLERAAFVSRGEDDRYRFGRRIGEMAAVARRSRAPGRDG